MRLELDEILLRIGMGFLTGFILGFERETHGRAAGLRTTVLVCVAATVGAILSDSYYDGSFVGDHASATWHPDPARLAAGIITGIGFLGAGVILQQGNIVRGVTTASQIWFVTILGLCYGSGQIRLGLVGLVVSLLTVFGLHYVERFIKRDWYATLTVSSAANGAPVSAIKDILNEFGMLTNHMELEHNGLEKTRTLVFFLRFKREKVSLVPQRLTERLLELPGIQRVNWK
jgi:putative Mg2+ transporter-C (MgtC) family protein